MLLMVMLAEMLLEGHSVLPLCGANAHAANEHSVVDVDSM